MTTPNLAKIERVDLREAWPNEARDFTPWLAANIGELGEALGMDLELQQTEAAVGGYSLDVLATDLNEDRPVIIENQLEATNHDHLGKLLTYAAGYDANVIVWLTCKFRDEHRAALDWLNQRTGDDTQFFGVVVELLRIDQSRLAPQFRMVATPNEWRKQTITKTRSTEAVNWSSRFAQNIRHQNNLDEIVQECAQAAVEHRTEVKMMNGRMAHCFLFSDDSRLAFSDDGYKGWPAKAWTYKAKSSVRKPMETALTYDIEPVDDDSPSGEEQLLIP